MTKQRIRKKSPIRKSASYLLKKAMQTCEIAMKSAVHRRDKVCQLCGSTVVLQCDHWISRKHKSTYFDVNNLTLLCARCHTNKSFGNHDYIQKVTEVVLGREGKKVCDELRKKSYQIKKWQIEELEQMTNAYDRLWV